MSRYKQTLQWDEGKTFPENLADAIRQAALYQADVTLESPDKKFLCTPNGAWSEIQPELLMK